MCFNGYFILTSVTSIVHTYALWVVIPLNLYGILTPINPRN